jgi:hypothetical protein
MESAAGVERPSAVLNLLIGVVDSNAARLGTNMIHHFSDVQHKLS